jgi:hypothetical protein
MRAILRMTATNAKQQQPMKSARQWNCFRLVSAGVVPSSRTLHGQFRKSLLFRVVGVSVGLRRLAGRLCCLIGVTCFGAFTFVVVIAVSAGVGLFAFLAELSSHPPPPLTGQVSNLAIQNASFSLSPHNQIEHCDYRLGLTLNADRKVLSKTHRTTAPAMSPISLANTIEDRLSQSFTRTLSKHGENGVPALSTRQRTVAARSTGSNSCKSI